MTEQQILDFYTGSGYNKSDLIKYLKSIVKKGYDLSYDESMMFIEFENFYCVVSPYNSIQFIYK